MRETKYRAWNKELKKMIYNIQDAYDTLGWTEEEGKIGYPCSSFGDFLIEDKFEVTQYTGLFDKNGKEIYEGDIVETIYRDNRKHKGTVYFQPTRLNWSVKHSAFANQDLFVYSRPDCSIEIIGNIYKNPELLNV